MEFLTNYGLFLMKLISVVIAILLIVAGIIAITSKNKITGKTKGKLIINKLNDKYKTFSETLLHAFEDKNALKALKKTSKATKKHAKSANRRLFIIDFHGDIRASQVHHLAETVNAILLIATAQDEILLRLESGGGMVHAYGLAASQLQRIRDAKLKLTIAIDKIAASGGYMMACVAETIIAAPFAVIGSIGVIAQLPNFYRYLQKKNIDFEQITAGDYKRTLTVLGENTNEDRKRMRQEVEDTHGLFKRFVQSHRPQVNIEEVANGKHWFANQAIDLKLVDNLQTSDDYLLKAYPQTDIYHVEYKTKKSLSKKLSSQMRQTLDGLFYQHTMES